MNPNPTIDNDLQKAIDDITNNTNADPVFGDPIAAPAPIAEPAPKPVASFPEVSMPPAPKPVMNFRPSPTPAPMPPAPAPAPAPMPPMPAPEPTPEPVKEPEVTESKFTESFVAEAEEKPEAEATELKDVKEAVLRDLAPMVDKLDIDPDKKFDLYKEIREDLHDDSVIPSAYEATKGINDDEKRADALLYLYDSLK